MEQILKTASQDKTCLYYEPLLGRLANFFYDLKYAGGRAYYSASPVDDAGSFKFSSTPVPFVGTWTLSPKGIRPVPVHVTPVSASVAAAHVSIPASVAAAHVPANTPISLFAGSLTDSLQSVILPHPGTVIVSQPSSQMFNSHTGRSFK